MLTKNQAHDSLVRVVHQKFYFFLGERNAVLTYVHVNNFLFIVWTHHITQEGFIALLALCVTCKVHGVRYRSLISQS